MERIDVRRLGRGPETFEWSVPPEELGLGEEKEFTGPVAIRLTAQQVGTRVLVSGKVSCRVRLECGRCLEPVERDLAADVAIEYREGSVPARAVDVIRDEDVDVSEYAHPFIDPGDDVRQILLVAVPPYPVCREECRGLCPRCGANLNVADCGHRADDAHRPFAGLSSLMEKER